MTDENLLYQALRKIDYIFRHLGIVLESSGKSAGLKLKYKFLFWFNFVWLNTDLAASIYWTIDGAYRGVSVTKLTYGVPGAAVVFVSNTRALCCLIYHKQISQLLAILRRLESEQSSNKTSSVKKKIVNDYKKFLFSVLKHLTVFNWTWLMLTVLSPLCLIVYEYHQTGQWNLKPIVYVKYPFDLYDIKYWPFVYLRQVWACVVVIFELTGTDCFYCICLTSVCLQFKLLQYEFTNFKVKNQQGSSFRSGTSQLELSNLTRLIVWHQQLIHCVNLVEVIYSKSTLLQILLSSLIICVSGFNVTAMEGILLVIMFSGFFFMSLVQIFVICYFGDKLMKCSTDVSLSIYNSQWYSTPATVRLHLHFIQTRAQKACKVTAYGFADIHLVAFTKVLKTAWSYFALLKTAYNPGIQMLDDK